MVESRHDIIERLAEFDVKYVVYAGEDTVVIVDRTNIEDIISRRNAGEICYPEDKFLSKGDRGYIASYMDGDCHKTARKLTECHAYKFLAGMRYGRDRKNKPRFKGQIYRGRSK